MEIRQIEITKKEKRHTEIYTNQEYIWHSCLVVAEGEFFLMV